MKRRRQLHTHIENVILCDSIQRFTVAWPSRLYGFVTVHVDTRVRLGSVNKYNLSRRTDNMSLTYLSETKSNLDDRGFLETLIHVGFFSSSPSPSCSKQNYL
ncbi:hypothetical protein J6590_079806 [Homalodisca vitripennis]|nr:hypothetical protein J6590_079806 [Homalodisca vitripennis]